MFHIFQGTHLGNCKWHLRTVYKTFYSERVQPFLKENKTADEPIIKPRKLTNFENYKPQCYNLHIFQGRLHERAPEIGIARISIELLH